MRPLIRSEVMSSKKRKKNTSPAMRPEVPARELERAREHLAGLGVDVTYTSARNIFKKTLGMTGGLANAVVVKLFEEGFEKGEQKNVFEHPNSPVTTGVVNGARREGDMKIIPQDTRVMSEAQAKAGFPVPIGARLIPGDVVELRKASNGWRVGRFIARPQRRWVCKYADGYYSRGHHFFAPVSSFAPFTLCADDIPEDVASTKAVELEILEEETPVSAAGYSDGYNYGLAEGVTLQAKFVRVVGELNDPLGEMAIAAAHFGVPISFSDETLAEAEKLPDHVDRRSLAHRVDLTDLPFVTIDGEDARDFDDAVCCVEVPEGGWRLLVAIADVSRYVKPGSALDLDAQKRATSVYFPASVVPMLPEKLSNGLCSLNPGVDRLVMVCDAMISPEGETTAYQFYPAVIHSHARLTYTIVWSALQGEAAGVEAVGPRLADLQRLYALYKALRAKRVERGALDFETKESAANIGEKGEILGFTVRDHNDAHRLIEEAMLVANVCAANFVLAHGQHTLFRVHDKPDAKRLTELASVLRGLGITWGTKKTPAEGTEEGTTEVKAEPLATRLARVIAETKDKPYVQTAILRTMQRACYQPENIGHFGLQFDAYAHFTSPIRRYPDLLLHRTIKGILAHRAYVPKVAYEDEQLLSGYHARKLGSRPEDENRPNAPKLSREGARLAAWTRLGIICSAAERRADDATRDVMNFLKCKFMKKRMGRVFDAVITGFCPAGAFVELTSAPIEGFVHISNLGSGYILYDDKLQQMVSSNKMTKYCIGDCVKVKLTEVDLEERRINFEMRSNLTRGTKVRGGNYSNSRNRGYGRYMDFPLADDDDDDDDFI